MIFHSPNDISLNHSYERRPPPVKQERKPDFMKNLDFSDLNARIL